MSRWEGSTMAATSQSCGTAREGATDGQWLEGGILTPLSQLAVTGWSPCSAACSKGFVLFFLSSAHLLQKL